MIPFVKNALANVKIFFVRVFECSLNECAGVGESDMGQLFHALIIAESGGVARLFFVFLLA